MGIDVNVGQDVVTGGEKAKCPRSTARSLCGKCSRRMSITRSTGHCGVCFFLRHEGLLFVQQTLCRGRRHNVSPLPLAAVLDVPHSAAGDGDCQAERLVDIGYECRADVDPATAMYQQPPARFSAAIVRKRAAHASAAYQRHTMPAAAATMPPAMTA